LNPAQLIRVSGLGSSRPFFVLTFHTLCPLITGYNRTLMAEFNYENKPVSSFLVDPTKERWSMYLMKTMMLPWLYWNRMLPGEPHEARYLKPFKPLVHAMGLDYREPKATAGHS
jgi:sulfide:quinone oxidoreductase